MKHHPLEYTADDRFRRDWGMDPMRDFPRPAPPAADENESALMAALRDTARWARYDDVSAKAGMLMQRLRRVEEEVEEFIQSHGGADV